jgi:hypothetical protein
MAFQYGNCRKIKIVIQNVYPEISSTNINEKVNSAKKKSISAQNSKIPEDFLFLEYQG